MTFLALLKNGQLTENVEELHTQLFSEESLHENKDKRPEGLLRDAGLKIKLITRTSFGVQIDFAKKYQDDDVKRILSDFNIKIRDKSVFVTE